MKAAWALAIVLSLTACGKDGDVEGYDAFASYVKEHQVGSDPDNWIEMRNSYGEWERTGLIFGYLGDYGECQKAIAGLKLANDAREYRCVPAN